MDVVYILGKGSLANNLEILYSVRSLYKYMADLRHIYIIGEDPGNLPGATHMYESDDSDIPWKNAYKKITTACRISDLSDDFLLMNDDFFLNEPTLGAEFPFYSLAGAEGGPAGPLSFAIHAPLRINKDWYLAMPDLSPMPKHFSPRSFYCNFYKAPSTPTNDFVIRTSENIKKIEEQIKDMPCFSIGDSTILDETFKKFLGKKYPDSSPLEKKPER